MDSWIDRLSIATVSVALISAITLLLLFFVNQFFKAPKKNIADKALLRELLESFDLEVPPELNETDPNVIKSIKTN
tara:strand:+ start:2583 stop:2810 length:228 start_codon:yes stop_codon:yes gene_type:complete